MPTHTQHALITWAPDSKEGAREASKLNGLFASFSVRQHFSNISGYSLGSYMSLVIVGRIQDFSKTFIQQILDLLKNVDWAWVVLAICDPDSKKSFEIRELAHYLAKKRQIKVSGTSRALTSDELGGGRAFALTLGEVLIRTNYEGSGKLWEDYDYSRIPSSHLGHEYYYLVFAHGGVPENLVGKNVPHPHVTVHFYCQDGDTTDQARQRNINADWPKLFNRFREGNTLPTEHIYETIQPGTNCQPLFAFPDSQIPGMGIYFISRFESGQAPYLVEKIAELPQQGTLLLNIIKTTVIPDARRRGLKKPLNLHWLACRAHFG